MSVRQKESGCASEKGSEFVCRSRGVSCVCERKGVHMRVKPKESDCA